jgi:hypothetical protein
MLIFQLAVVMRKNKNISGKSRSIFIQGSDILDRDIMGL